MFEAVPEFMFQTIDPWLDIRPTENTYESLKSTILKEFTTVSSVRATRLLDLSKQPPGERTAIQLWHEILTLRQRTELDSDTESHMAEMSCAGSTKSDV